MIKISFIANIGQDAQVRTSQEGKEFISFNACANEGKDKNHWISCSSNSFIKLAPWLKKGQCIYGEGFITTRVYVARDGSNQVGLNCYLTQLELVGKAPEVNQQANQQASQQVNQEQKKDDCTF